MQKVRNQLFLFLQEDEALEVQGSNQYTAPDGTPVQITYVANENGYQPQVNTHKK